MKKTIKIDYEEYQLMLDRITRLRDESGLQDEIDLLECNLLLSEIQRQELEDEVYDLKRELNKPNRFVRFWKALDAFGEGFISP